MKLALPLLPLLLAGMLGLCAPGCVTVEPDPGLLSGTEVGSDEEEELLRLAEAVERLADEDSLIALNRIERLMLSWERQQRAASAAPLELILKAAVIRHFDALVEMLAGGPHERRVTAAWALGFAEVPENDLGLPRRQAEAVAALTAALEDASDDIVQNVMVAFWNLGDPTTPLQPVFDVVMNHHDPVARSNATLALTTILDKSRAAAAQGTVLVAFEDKEAKVRLHAASVVRRFPSPVYTRHIEQLILSEKEALVRANMALALGAGKSRSSARYLLPLLESPRKDAADARRALIAIFGQDLGPAQADWRPLVP